MRRHVITVSSPDELDRTVQYLKQNYALVERHNNLAIMHLPARPTWKYIRDVLLYLMLCDVPVSPQFPISDTVRNIPSGTNHIEIHMKGASA